MPSVFLYLLDTMSDWEYGNVLAELRSGRYFRDPTLSYNVVLCGQNPDPVTTMGGLHLQPDSLISTIHPGAGDLLLLPGADTWLDPAQDPVIVKVQEVLKGDAVVAAICGATLALANAGLLDNRPHTSNDPVVLKMFCPRYKGGDFYVNEPAVTDGNLITASGLAPVEFACHILQRLDVISPAALDAWYNLYTTRKPEFFYALMESLPKRSGTR